MALVTRGEGSNLHTSFASTAAAGLRYLHNSKLTLGYNRNRGEHIYSTWRIRPALGLAGEEGWEERARRGGMSG